MAISKFSKPSTLKSAEVNYSSFSAGTSKADPSVPPISNGLAGQYTANTWDSVNKIWRDNSGNENHAIASSNDVGNAGINDLAIVTNSAAFGSSQTFPVLQGTAGSKLLFPKSILPPVYTLFYVARYNTSNASTAATNLHTNTGNSNAYFQNPFGNDSTSVINNEVRASYAGADGDMIWTGYQWNNGNVASYSAGNKYLFSIDCRTSSGAYASNGSEFVVYGWDSQQNMTHINSSLPRVKAERVNSSAIIQMNTGFSFGSIWIRGRQQASAIFGSGNESYFSNMEVWRLSQEYCHKIFAGENKAWYSGFYAGNAGSIQHGNVKYTSNNKSNNWVLGTDTPNIFRVGKSQLWSGTSTSADTSPSAQLAINPTLVDGSNFQVAEVIVYDRILSTSEITSTENYLSSKYGI